MYRNNKIYPTWSYFVYIFHMALPTKKLSKGMIQLFLWLSVFVLRNTNRCISSIVYENTTTFSLVQRFVMTVINKCMLCQQVIFNIMKIIYTYVYSISHCSQNTGCTQATYSIPDTGVIFITFLTHAQSSISYICEFFTVLGGHCLYNSCLLIIFPILGAELMTASCY